MTGFFGKWHLGALTDAVSPDCQAVPASGNCTQGYDMVNGSLCCDGRDAGIPVMRPTDVGFDVALATPQVAPTATSNCGCVGTVRGAGLNCSMGHYEGCGHYPASQPWLECDQYFASWPLDTDTDTEDADVIAWGEDSDASGRRPHRPASSSVYDRARDDGNGDGDGDAVRVAAADAAADADHGRVRTRVDGRGRMRTRTSMSSVQGVTPVDDAAYLTDNLLAFVARAVAKNQSFFAQLSFHQNHIPYVSPPEFRALYPTFDMNHQDYYGALSAMDAQVGRIRRALRRWGVADNTFLALTSDNGPEVDTGGHGCYTFQNPGETGGLLGRKRALTEGGIRVPGLVEFPALVKEHVSDVGLFPASTSDFLPTLLDLIGAQPSPPDWPLDGVSLLPFLAGSVRSRSDSQPIGWLSDAKWIDFPNGTMVKCASRPLHKYPPSFPANFSTVFHQAQFAWSEGPLKLFACNDVPENPDSWHFALFDLQKDPGETTDLWRELGASVGDGLFSRFLSWQDSVRHSIAHESQCVIGPHQANHTHWYPPCSSS